MHNPVKGESFTESKTNAIGIRLVFSRKMCYDKEKTEGRACMLLAIDIGNSNISVGLFGKEKDLKFLGK